MSEEKNYIRTMLVNSKSHRYVAELDTMGVSEYMQLMIKSQQGVPSFVLDFSPLVEILHKNIDKNNEYHEERDVKLGRSSIYNVWRQIKVSSDSSFAGALGANLVTKSEDILNLIHSRLPGLTIGYRASYQDTPFEAQSKRVAAFSSFVSNIEAALEILLCRVYISAKFGFETLTDDVVMTGHCRAIRNVVLEELKNDVCYNEAQADFYHHSPLYHACIENIGINPNALCYLLGSSVTSEDFKDRLIAEGSNSHDGYGRFQTTLHWIWCDPDKAERIRALSKMLVRLNMLLGMLEELHGAELQFDDENRYREDFKDALAKLLI
ncbi:hypothetical protein JFT61_11985 [Pseudomonas fluorescens]|nr:hypothetical protein [Pseudomonas fluorescens]